MNEKTDIKSLNLQEMQEFMLAIGEKKFRAKQIYEWLHEKQVTSFSEMTNLSKKLQEKLEECAVNRQSVLLLVWRRQQVILG